jgi:hypothetical protein
MAVYNPNTEKDHGLKTIRVVRIFSYFIVFCSLALQPSAGLLVLEVS